MGIDSRPNYEIPLMQIEDNLNSVTTNIVAIAELCVSFKLIITQFRVAATRPFCV